MASEKFSAVVEIKGGVTTSFSASVADTVSSVGRLKKGLGELSKAQGNIRKFGESGEKIGMLSKRLDEAKVKLGAAREELAKAPRATEKLTYGVQKAEDAVKRLEASLGKEQATLRRSGNALRAAGVDTRNLAAEQRRLEAQAQKTAAAMRRQERAQGAFSASKEGVYRWGRAGAAVAATGYMAMGPVRDAAKYQETQIDFSKFVAGADTEAGLKRLSGEVLNIGKNSLLGANGVGQLVNGYGKIGMGIDEALEAAKATETLAVGLEMTADEASTLITKIKTGMKLSVKETLEMGDAVNYIGDVTAADAKRTAEILQRQGSLIKATTTLTNDQITALAASFDMAAPNAESGATAMKNFTRGLSRGIGTSKMGRKAWELIGMDPVKVAADMQKDGVGTMVRVLRGIAKVAGKNRDFVMSRIFGEESKGQVGYWLGNVDEFEKNMRALDDRSRFLGRSLQEQERQLSGLGAKWTVFGHRMEVLRIKLGGVFLPYLTRFLDMAGAGLDRVMSLIDDHPELVKNVALAAGGVFLLTSAVVALGSALSVVKFAMAGFNLGLANMAVRRMAARNAVLGVAGEAAAGGTMSGRGRGAGKAARGVAAAGMAGASLGSAAGWGRVLKGVWRGAWRGVMTLINPLKWLKGAWLAIAFAGKSLLLPALSAVGGVVSALLSPVGLLVAALVAVGVAVWKYWEPIKGFVKGVWSGFMDGMGPILEVVGEFRKALEFKDAGGNVTALGKAWGWLCDKVSAAWGWLKRLLTPLSQSSAETKRATEAGVRFGKVLAEYVAKGLKWLLSLFGKCKRFADGFAEAFSQFVGPIRKALGEVWKALGELWKEIDKTLRVSDGLRVVWDLLRAAAGGVWKVISDLLGPLGESGEKMNDVAAAGRGLGEVVGTVLCGGLRAVTGEIKCAIGYLDKLYGALMKVAEYVTRVYVPVWKLLGVNMDVFSLGDKDRESMLYIISGGRLGRMNAEKVAEWIAEKGAQEANLNAPLKSDLKPATQGAKPAAVNNNTVTINVSGAKDPRETGREVLRALAANRGFEGWSMLDGAVMDFA